MRSSRASLPEPGSRSQSSSAGPSTTPTDRTFVRAWAASSSASAPGGSRMPQSSAGAAARLTLERLVGDLPEGVLGEDELDRVVAEEPLVLLDERVLRLGQDLDEILALQLMHSRHHRQPADELRDQPVREQILRHHLAQQFRRLDRVLRADVSAEADRVLADPLRDDLFEVGERTAADEEDVRDILTDVAGLGQRRRVGDRERDVEDPRERLREQRLATASRPEQKDVRLLQLDVRVVGLHHLHALVVVVDRYGERALGLLLPDDVIVEDVVDLARLGEILDV